MSKRKAAKNQVLRPKILLNANKSKEAITNLRINRNLIRKVRPVISKSPPIQSLKNNLQGKCSKRKSKPLKLQKKLKKNPYQRLHRKNVKLI
jgi:hypothetical protein